MPREHIPIPPESTEDAKNDRSPRLPDDPLNADPPRGDKNPIPPRVPPPAD